MKSLMSKRQMRQETIMEMEPNKDDLQREAEALLIEIYGNEWRALHEEGYRSERDFLNRDRDSYTKDLKKSIGRHGSIAGSKIA